MQMKETEKLCADLKKYEDMAASAEDSTDPDEQAGLVMLKYGITLIRKRLSVLEKTVVPESGTGAEHDVFR